MTVDVQKAARAAAICRSLKMVEVEDGWELCFPELYNFSCWKLHYTWAETLFIDTALYSISVLTAVLNLFIIISVSHFRQLHTPTNILLLSLAVSDFLVGLLLMPADAVKRTHCWVFGDLLCSLYRFVINIILSASVVNMVLISVDRYLAICDPLHYTTRITVHRVKVCVCLVWFCAVAYNSYFFKLHLIQQEENFPICYGECPGGQDNTGADLQLVLNFIVPVTAIIVLYSRIFVVAVSQARAMRSHITAVTKKIPVTKTAKKSELKAARTLGVLVVVFLICFMPTYFARMGGIDYMSYSTMFFILYLYYFNSCLNPVIYALFYPWFRKAVKLIVTLQILQPGSCEANIL
ncbi:trace amine-associated receptor 13c-like [Centropristis striata]|uniref:trace amine-associated receptor 13c-like n=1 Tax=Centropristis striata TaxID=184440 RepID=UPI0027E19761|nr:trace amine-associated receptor 13c-like [Centropristis striata]